MFRVVKETIGSLAESEKEVEFAAREMEYIIMKEKKAMEAVRVTEEKVVAIGFRLEEEERELQVLYIPLRN